MLIDSETILETGFMTLALDGAAPTAIRVPILSKFARPCFDWRVGVVLDEGVVGLSPGSLTAICARPRKPVPPVTR
jgi:hypothetical protein